MVDLKLLLLQTPFISPSASSSSSSRSRRRSGDRECTVLRHRRSKFFEQIITCDPKMANFLPFSSHVRNEDGDEDSSDLAVDDYYSRLKPRLKRKYIFGAVVLVIIIVLLVLGFTTDVFSKRKKLLDDNNDAEDTDHLVPPNPTKPLPPSASRLHIFNRAAVCADGPPCAEIGRDILAKNGSAVDATIAAMFCNGMVTMQSMGMGGGFLMVIYDKKQRKSFTLDARETAPKNATIDMYNKDPLLSQQGPLAVAVPGELRGYWAAHQKFGRLPWADLVQPTIDLCEKGYNISEHQYNSFFKNKIDKDPQFREWFYDANGKLKKMGSLVQPKKLCATLKMVAKNGGNDLYDGELSKMFVQDIQEAGGIITADDMKNYQVEWREPITATFKNKDTLHTVPPPSSGVLLSFILNILDGYGFNPDSIDGIDNTVTTYHRVIEAFKYAYAKRTELGDMNFNNISELISNLTSKEIAEATRLKIKDNATSTDPKYYGAVYYNKDDHGTAHLSVLSEEGDAVSVTSSVNIYFGAGLTSKQTGIIFNSVMNDFSYPDVINYFGLPGSPNNKMEPGKRALSSMSPAILTDANGDVKLVVGASGGTKITTTVAQIIMRSLWFGENIKEAVDAPRIHHQLYPMRIEYEYGTLQQVVDGLKAIGHKVKRNSGSIVCALLKQANKIIGNADYRKKGEVFGIM